jgi:intracellular multiplication protein IcmG
MTNQYGSDSETPQETAAEEPGVEQQETWQDDQPPVDDFADPEQAAEGEATISNESETAADNSDAASSANNGGRKSMFLPIAAGIGGIVFLGAVAWWQFGGHSSSDTQPSPMINAMQAPAPTLPPPAASSQAAAPTGPLDLNAIYASAQQPQATPPAPSTQPMPPASLNVQPVPPTPAAAMAAPSASSAALETAPTTALAPAAIVTPVKPAKESSKQPPEIVTPAPAVATSAPAPISEADQTRLATLAARIDDLQKSLDHMNTQLNQINTEAAAGPVLEDRLNRVEQQLLQVKHEEETVAAGAAASKPSASASVAAEAPMAMDAAEEHTAPAHKASVKKSKSVSHKTKTHSTKTAKAPAATSPVPVTHWVLRAATPGEAWVSESATSSELRHIQVGDTLPGIGRIKAIRQAGDSWIVDGSTGSLR